MEIDFEDEDESVVIEGSDLYKVLSDMGYTDFECIPINARKSESPIPVSETKENPRINEEIHNYLTRLHSWVLQEEKSSYKHITSILQSESLLDDHRLQIEGFLVNYSNCFWRDSVQWILVLSSTFFTSISLSKRNGILPMVLSGTPLMLYTYWKYTGWSSQRNLNTLVSIQNDIYRLSTKALRILKHYYKISYGTRKGDQKFTGFNIAVDRFKHIQSMTEILLKCTSDLSQLYQQTFSVLSKLLPYSATEDNFATSSMEESFSSYGEINYEIIKKSYYTYILIQSDLTTLLATAYHTGTWREASVIPRMKLSHIVNRLINYLKRYQRKLSNVIRTYENHKTVVVKHKWGHKGTPGSKWQDIYVNLDLTSRKLQFGYDNILKILENTEPLENAESVEKIMDQLNVVYKEIDTAKSFVEFATLLLAKTRLVESKGKDELDEEVASQDRMEKSKTRTVVDTSHEIVDEVFEEYIKEEYLKPLCEEMDLLNVRDYKLDKLLAKNFMCELKEALIDKQKSMAERESKALQRMYRNVTRDSVVVESEKCDTFTPVPAPLSLPPAPPPPPPPPPPHPIITDFPANSNSSENVTNEKIRLPIPRPRTKVKSYNNTEFIENEEIHRQMFALPKVNLGDSSNNEESRFGIEKFSIALPVQRKIEEEIFIGSGENSEEEIAGSGCEDDESFP